MNAINRLAQVERGVAVGPRPILGRLGVEWLIAAGVMTGMAAIAIIVHHNGISGPQAAPHRGDLIQAVVAARPRFSR